MILSCNSCKKKFVVPDQAITAAGRVVQCGSCGSKWKQFPINNKTKTLISKTEGSQKKILKSPKPKKKSVEKTRKLSLYSPEYLAKKHGIYLNNPKSNTGNEGTDKVSFGFYNSLIIFIFILIVLSRGLYFFQDLITEKMPATKFYLDYFFESIKNTFEIIKALIINY